MRWSALGTWFAASGLLVACGTPTEREPPPMTTTFPMTSPMSGTSNDGSGDSSPTSAGTGADTTVGADSATTSGSSDGFNDGPPIFDVSIPDAGENGAEGCRNIDFLFVIDNSGSMSSQQQQLLDSFPGFIQAIQETLVDVDSYHVGVMTSDPYSGNEPGCNQLGALVTQTGGSGSSNMVCGPFAEGNRFITEQDDLNSAFQCLGQVGVSGSGIEQPVSALVAGVQSPLSDAGGCNEGFIRDDAILVVVVVTDDPPYPGTADDAHPFLADIGVWHDPVLAAKADNPDAVVVIGFIPWDDTTCVCPWCCPGTGCNEPSPNLIDFVQSFGSQGVLASVCEMDYSAIFAQTIETIDATCQNFDPPG